MEHVSEEGLLGRHRGFDMNSFAVVVEVACRFISVTTDHEIAFSWLDKNHSEMRGEGRLVFAHRSPFMNNLCLFLVIVRLRALIVLHDLALLLLPEFF